MSRTVSCCPVKDCDHEVAVNYDKSTGWVISMNSPKHAKVLENYSDRKGVLMYKPLSANAYAMLKTKDSTIAKLIISELC